MIKNILYIVESKFTSIELHEQTLVCKKIIIKLFWLSLQPLKLYYVLNIKCNAQVFFALIVSNKIKLHYILYQKRINKKKFDPLISGKELSSCNEVPLYIICNKFHWKIYFYIYLWNRCYNQTENIKVIIIQINSSNLFIFYNTSLLI